MENSEELSKLFTSVQQKFAGTSLGGERWYLLVLAAMAGGGEPERASALYRFLAAERGTPGARQQLVRRLREALVKLVPIYGVCKSIEAVLAINGEEREEDKDRSCSRRGWTSGPDNVARGREYLRKIYAGNLEATLALFDDHRDFAWLSEEITYGLFLSDRQVLDDMDTEVVVLAGIMIQNLPRETMFHLRGCRRVGISLEDVKVLWECIQQVGEYCGVRLDKVPKPEDVESQV